MLSCMVNGMGGFYRLSHVLQREIVKTLLYQLGLCLFITPLSQSFQCEKQETEHENVPKQ